MHAPDYVKEKLPMSARVSAFLRHDRTLRFIGGYVTDVFTTIILLLAYPDVMISSPVLMIWAGMIAAIFIGSIIQLISYFDSGRYDPMRLRWVVAGSLPVVFLRSILILVLWI